ncbi:MAG: PIN domain-containing protein [Armatimonadaceae bacterium]
MTLQYALPPFTADKVGTSIPEYLLRSQGFLLDTNIVIDLVTNLIALTGSIATHFISVITLVELCKNTNADASGLDAYVRDLLRADAMIVDIEIAKVARYLRSTTRLKVPDAVIAATALHNGLTLVTEDRQILAIPHIRAIGYDRFMTEMGASND